MNLPDLNYTADIGVTYHGTLGSLDKASTKFVSDSTDSSMLIIYLVMMVYIIGGLNVLKLKFLYPSLEDLCSIYADVMGGSDPEKIVLSEDYHILVLHER